jgi:ATP-dependent HslUV protease ATP-binding subunit HslU
MIGPTGVGKTEIARRLARLAQSPFIKVEASKFTEVGYVGRDVESMVRDLVELAVDMVREERRGGAREGAPGAEERLLDLLLPPLPPAPDPDEIARPASRRSAHARAAARAAARGPARRQAVEIEVREKSLPSFEIIAGSSVEEIGINLKDMLPGMFQGRGRRSAVARARGARALAQEEAQKLIDMESVSRAAAVERVEQAGHHLRRRDRQDRGPRGRPRPRREPRGRAARHPADRRGDDGEHQARHGATDHILFIAAGAFHVSKPSDLIPSCRAASRSASSSSARARTTSSAS